MEKVIYVGQFEYVYKLHIIEKAFSNLNGR